MEKISIPGEPKQEFTSDKALKAIYELADSHLAVLLINLAKFPSDRYAYLDLKDNFDKFYTIINFIIIGHNLKSRSMVQKIEGYEAFNRQLSVYKNAAIGYEQNNQLIKLCEIAIEQLKIRIPQKYINDLQIEDDLY